MSNVLPLFDDDPTIDRTVEVKPLPKPETDAEKYERKFMRTAAVIIFLLSAQLSVLVYELFSK